METITPIVSRQDLQPGDAEQVKAFDMKYIGAIMHDSLVDSNFGDHSSVTITHAYVGAGDNKLEVWDFRSKVVGHYRDRRDGDVWLILASGHTFNLDSMIRQLSDLQDELTNVHDPV